MKHYFTTSGRTGRIEYIVLFILCPFFAGTIDWFIHLFSSNIVPLNIVLVVSSIIGFLAIGWVFFTAIIRRMHDLNFSGWWLLLILVIAFIILAMGFGLPLLIVLGCGKMVLCFCPGDKQKNKFGPVPDIFGGFLAENKKLSATNNPENGRISFKL